MPSPRNSSPAPRRSFFTSSLNDRSAMCVLLLRLAAIDLIDLATIDLACRPADYIQKNISLTGPTFIPRGNHACDLHCRLGRHGGGILGLGSGNHLARRLVLRRGYRILQEF